MGAGFLLSAFFFSALAQTNKLTVTLKDGTKLPVELGTVRKLSFANGSVFVNYFSQNADSYVFPSVGTITFSGETAIHQLSSTRPISVYPNPVTDVASILNLPEGQSRATLYTGIGIALSDVEIEAGGKLDLSKFPKGFYVLKVNSQAIKFMKR